MCEIFSSKRRIVVTNLRRKRYPGLSGLREGWRPANRNHCALFLNETTSLCDVHSREFIWWSRFLFFFALPPSRPCLPGSQHLRAQMFPERDDVVGSSSAFLKQASRVYTKQFLPKSGRFADNGAYYAMSCVSGSLTNTHDVSLILLKEGSVCSSVRRVTILVCCKRALLILRNWTITRNNFKPVTVEVKEKAFRDVWSSCRRCVCRCCMRHMLRSAQ